METILLLLLLSISTGYTGSDYASSGHGLGGKCMCHTVDGREIILPPDLAFYDGKLTRWYENGQKSLEANYKDGDLDGKWTEWYENGQKSLEANYKDGDLDGKVAYWNIDGTINKVEYYKNGVLVG